MRSVLLLMLTGCSAATLPPAPNKPPAASWDASYKFVLDSGRQCSAVAVASNKFYTAGHCAEEAGVLVDRSGGRYPVARPLASAAEDIAIGTAALLPSWASVGEPVLRTGVPVLVSGYGCTDELWVRPSAWVSQSPVYHQQYTVVGPVCPGDSGGGVFGPDGKLWAVLSGRGSSGADGLGFVVLIRDF